MASLPTASSVPSTTSAPRVKPARVPNSRKLAEEPALAVRGVLRHERRGAAVLTAGREALDHAQHDERDRRPDAGRLVAGQDADEEGGRGHHHDRGGQHAAAAEAVAERAEDQAAEGADQEGHREDQQRVQRRGALVVGGEEHLLDVDRGVGVDAVVEPLGGVAHRGGADRAAQHGGPLGPGGRASGWSGGGVGRGTAGRGCGCGRVGHRVSFTSDRSSAYPIGTKGNRELHSRDPRHARPRTTRAGARVPLMPATMSSTWRVSRTSCTR